MPVLQVGDLIAEGSSAWVYQVHSPDSSTASALALKVFKDIGPDAQQQLVEEVSYLTKLKHPGLVRIHGVSLHGEGIEGIDGPCFWMERIQGQSLEVALKQASAEQARLWLQEALQALDYLHEQGVLHGDLKPANIMIDAVAQVRLLDFGFAQLWQERHGVVGTLRGSLPYLAPECVQAEAQPASDLFALGTIFYEALSGHHPRAGAKQLQDLFNPDFQPLQSYRADLPSRFCRVIDRLIRSSLTERFTSAEQVLTALQVDTSSELAPSSYHTFKLFGREDEWQQVVKHLNVQQAQQRPTLVVIHGVTGVGKSRFVQELRFHCALQGYPMLSDRSEVSGVTSLQRREIYDMLTGTAPAILILEYNDDELSSESKLFFEQLRRDANVFDLPLQALSSEASWDFFQAMLGGKLASVLSEDIYRATEGLPALLTQLAQEWLTHSDVSSRLQDREFIAQFQQPEKLHQLTLKRIQSLASSQQEVLQAIGMATVPVSRNDLIKVLTQKPLQIAEHLNELNQLSLIRTSAERSGAWQLNAQGLGDDSLVQGAAACQWHERWLAYWTQLESSADDSLDIERACAEHAIAIGGHPQLLKWIKGTVSASLVKERGEYAIDLLLRALKLNLSGKTREELLRQLANLYGMQGRFQENLTVLEQWYQEFPEDSLQLNPIKYALATAVALKNLGRKDEARERLQGLIAISDPEQESHRIRLSRAYSLFAILALDGADFTVARTYFNQAHDLLPIESPQRAELYTHQALWAVEQSNWDQAVTYLDLATGIYQALDDRLGLFSVSLERGNLALRLGRLSEVEQGYGDAVKYAKQQHDEALLARAYQNLGAFANRRGDYTQALDFLQQAQQLFTFFGSWTEQETNSLELAIAYGAVGHKKRAEQQLQQVLQNPADESADVRRKEVFCLLNLFQGVPPYSGEVPTSLNNVDDIEPWELELRWLKSYLASPVDVAELKEVLSIIYEGLSPPLKISFEERPDYQLYVQTVLNHHEGGMDMDAMSKLTNITTQLLGSDDINEVLQLIMEASMDLSRAERGFLLVSSDESSGPIPGFEVQSAKNMSKELIHHVDFKVSLSAVQQVLQSGETLVTDNAIMDERFASAASVQELELKSILVVPLRVQSKVEGVLYLDHSYQTEIFRGADLELLQAFVDQAALALQKARLINQLKQSNNNLSSTVETQSSELSLLRKELAEQRQQLTYEYGEIIGYSPAMLEVLELVDRLVDTSIPVWIFGESGTGKEMIARALHFKGVRAAQSFVSENCSSLPETLLESELFGHKKGAFTHADRDKIGLLQHADGGTIFLDEIADMSPTLQAKLLRFLQEGEIRPLGSNQVLKVDVRVVSASNQDLQQLIGEGKFREDLFYRLNGMMVHLPALRERIEDIPLLVQHFLKKQAEKEGRVALAIEPEALELLTHYQWPGNVRELENTIRSASLFQYKKKLLPKSFHFKKELFGGTQSVAVGAQNASSAGGQISAEKRVILQALKDNAYNKKLAAEELGISRRYLYTQLQRHSIPIKRVTMKAYVEQELSLGE